MSSPKITVEPTEFHYVSYDADTIARVVAEVAELLGVANPIHVVVDERTPLSKAAATVDGRTSDSLITIRAESGALEDTRHFTHFSEDAARQSLGRMLLRARDRLRDDFADVPSDLDLSHADNAAWDAYCAGRLARRGVAVNVQRWRYNYRNRWGFTDQVDTAFERLWSADDLSWADVTTAVGLLRPATR